MTSFNSLSHLSLLAQNGASGLPPGPDARANAATPAVGADGAPMAAPDPGFNILLLILPILVLMILFSVMGSRKERKRREALLASVKKHDRVQTIGGVIGSVVELKPDTVVLKVDENSNLRMTFARSAIQQIVKEAPENKDAPQSST
jgi:preprotein translocase subunit YajC